MSTWGDFTTWGARALWGSEPGTDPDVPCSITRPGSGITLRPLASTTRPASGVIERPGCD